MHILELEQIDNIAEHLDEARLNEIGSRVVQEYNTDKQSMDDWLGRNELAMDLIDLRAEEVVDPWPGAANTKLPLVLNAAMKVSAEEYSEVIKGDDMVKAALFGAKTPPKELRASRVTKRMNYQYFHELTDWEEDHDKLILAKNLLGTVHKKYFFSREKGQPQCVLRRTGVVINDGVEHIEDAPRITDEIEKFHWEVAEKIRSEEWLEIEAFSEVSDYAQSDKMNTFLEQVRREDLDDDGYPETYIVTVHKNTQKVVRIAPNYTPESIKFDDFFDYDTYAQANDEEKAQIHQHLKVVRVDNTKTRVRYVKYEMIPSYEGGYWGFGFGILLGPLNENCNEVVNQLLNQGAIANSGGGFINAGIKMASGELRFRKGEWKRVQSGGMDLSRNVFPLPVRDPSQTLFSLLGLLMDVLRDLSSVTEVMSGEQPHSNMPFASIAALMEQGKKTFNSIYKRHWRALGKEFKALYTLNYLYEDPAVYVEFHDLQELEIPEGVAPAQFFKALVQGDFESEGLDIVPTAKSEFSSRLQKLSQGQALFQLANDPDVERKEIIRLVVESIVDDQELSARIVPPQPQMTTTDMMQQIQLKTQEFLQGNEARKSEAEASEAEVKLQTAIVQARKAGIELPLHIERLSLQVEKAEAAVENEKAKGGQNEDQ